MGPLEHQFEISADSSRVEATEQKTAILASVKDRHMLLSLSWLSMY